MASRSLALFLENYRACLPFIGFVFGIHMMPQVVDPDLERATVATVLRLLAVTQEASHLGVKGDDFDLLLARLDLWFSSFA